MAALDDGAHRRHAVRVGHDDVGLVVDDEQRVGCVDDVLVDRDTVEVLLEDGAQVGVLAAQPVALALDGLLVEQHLVVPLEEVVEVVPLLDHVTVLARGGGLQVDGRGLQRLAQVGGVGGRLLLLLDGGLVEGQHLLALRLELTGELGEAQDALGLLELGLQRLERRLRVDDELLQPPALALAELVHARLELLEVARDGVLLLAQRAVALVALALVGGELGLPVRQRVLQPLQLAHLHLDRLGALLVLDGEVLEVLRALLGGGHVVGVRRVEVPLELLDEPLEREAQHVVLLRVLALDLLAVRVELLPRLALLLVELGLHERHDVEHLLLVLGVPRQNLARLRAKLLDELLQIPLELKLDAPDLGIVQVDQPVDHEQVRAQRHLVLLLRVLEVPVEHLDDGVLAVDFPLVVLRDDLDLLAEILHLDEPHQLAPLVEDLEPVDA
mmetsp:Transcript_22423/g.53224  ORF Transcript_22423/g.53224 Transcript_22423/m.53224 type:complete len:443 (-) Transcript_22423:248-1576(-)